MGNVASWVMVAVVSSASMAACSGNEGTAAGASAAAGQSGATMTAAGTSSGAGATGSSTSASDYAAAFCGAARACCTKEGLDIAGLAECEAEAVTQINPLQALVRGTAQAVEPAFSDCVAAWQTLGESCQRSAELAVCASAFVGTALAGEPCRNVVDCVRGATPLACIKHRENPDDPSPELGACRSLVQAAEGEPCLVSTTSNYFGVTYTTPELSPPLSHCSAEDGLYCAFAERVCTPFAKADAPCTSPEQCAPGLGCVDDTCSALKPAGEPCTSSEECAAGTLCRDDQCTVPPFAYDGLCEGDLD
jgi:hypothetical protein